MPTNSIYDLQKKSKKFKWTQEAEIAFKEIKELLISLPVLRAPTHDCFFQIEIILHMKVLEAHCFKSKRMNGLLLVIIPKDYQPQQRILESLN